VEDPIRVQQVQGVGHAVGPEQLTGVGRAQQPTVGGEVEGRREGSGWEGGFVAVEAEAHHTLGRQIDRQPSRCLGRHGTRMPVGGDHEPEPDVDSSRSRMPGVEHELQRVAL
jgi:hypothetical protein